MAFSRGHATLIAVGAVSELAYALYFLHQFPLLTYYRQDIDMGGITGHSRSGFWIFIIVFTCLFLLTGAGWWLADHKPDRLTY